MNENQQKIGQILLRSNGNEDQFLGVGFLIYNNIIICPHHLVNSCDPKQIYFFHETTQVTYPLITLEDGALLESPEDYIIFELNILQQSPLNNYFNLSKNTDPPPSQATVLGYEEKMGKREITSSTVDVQYTDKRLMSLSTQLSGYRGLSGAPIIDNKEILGMHLRGTKPELEMPFEPSIELSFSEWALANNDINDYLLYILLHKEENAKQTKLSERQQTPLTKFDEAGLFKDFTKRLPWEQDEGARRKAAFSNTPPVEERKKVGTIARKVLLRWFLKGKAKYQNQLISDFNFGPSIIKELWDIYNALRHNTPLPTKEILTKTKIDFTKINDWSVAIIGENETDRSFHKLNEKYKSGSRTLNALESGHKLGCSVYWNKGSETFIQERLKKKKDTYLKKHPNNCQQKLKEKEIELKNRYSIFKTPAKKHYDTLDTGNEKLLARKDSDKNFQTKFSKQFGKPFMKDHRNYAFQWCESNHDDGRSKKTPNFDIPPGHKWCEFSKSTGFWVKQKDIDTYLEPPKTENDYYEFKVNAST